MRKREAPKKMKGGDHMTNGKKKWILCIGAGLILLTMLSAGGIYYILTRYYFYNVYNLHAKKAMTEHLDYRYAKPFELLSTEFETVEINTDKFKGYAHIWTYTLADDEGMQFQAYVWSYSLVDRGAGNSHGSDYYTYVSDTYVEESAGSLSYKIEEDEEGYIVSVYDDQEALLYESSYPKKPVINRIGKDTLEIHEGAGNTWWSVFVNGETKEVSEPVADVLASNEQIVIYPVFEGGVFKIVVRDIYDGNAYEEITDDFPPVAAGNGFIKEAKVLDSYTVYLNYYTGNDGNADEWEEKRIVLNLHLKE